MFVLRVDKSTEVNIVENYVKDKGVTVNEIKCLSKPEAMYKSFKVSILLKDKEKVMSADIWLDDIGCRDFVPSRKRNNETTPSNIHDG